MKKPPGLASTSFSGRTEKAYIARSASRGACVCDSVKTTVLALGAVIDLTAVMRKPQPPLTAWLARWIDQTASCAVTAVPSENLALRKWKV